MNNNKHNNNYNNSNDTAQNHTPLHLPLQLLSRSEASFGVAMKNVLNESAQALPDATLDKLRVARRAALLQRKQVGVDVSFLGRASTAVLGMVSRLGAPMTLALPAILIGAGLYTMSANNADNYLQTVAEIDTQVLVQDVPLDALLDKGFVRYVQVGE